MKDLKIPETNVSETYQRIADDSAYPVIDEYGNITKLVKDESFQTFIEKLIQIEKFIEAVLENDEIAFSTKTGGGVKRFPLSTFYDSVLKNLCLSYSPDYEYTAIVDLFFTCCSELGLERMRFTRPLARVVGDTNTQKRQYEVFNELVDLIRCKSRQPEFQRKLSRMAEKSADNCLSAATYIDALFQHVDKRLLVLRVDLSYRRDIARDITAEQAKEDLEHLLNNRRGNKKLFGHWAGYIRKLEWGPEKGMHFHLVIFYKGSKRCKDVYLAEALGEYWKEITNGRGIYWNCNANKDDYWRLGIGMIAHDDAQKRKILIEDVVSYLVKSEQALKAKKLGEGKCFVRGIMPT